MQTFGLQFSASMYCIIFVIVCRSLGLVELNAGAYEKRKKSDIHPRSLGSRFQVCICWNRYSSRPYSAFLNPKKAVLKQLKCIFVLPRYTINFLSMAQTHIYPTAWHFSTPCATSWYMSICKMFSSIAYKQLPKDEQQGLAEEQDVTDTRSTAGVRQIFLNALLLVVILLASNLTTWFISKRISIPSHGSGKPSLDIPTPFGTRKMRDAIFYHNLMFY